MHGQRGVAGIFAVAALLCISARPAIGDDEWQFSVAPLYLWAKNIDGTSSAGGRESPLSLDFKEDILENLDAAFAIHAEASKGDWTFFAEYNFARLEPGVERVVGPALVKVDLEFEDTMSEAGVAWSFADAGSLRWEALGGLRYYKQDLTMKFSNNLDIERPGRTRLRAGDSWMQPFAGVRVSTALSERWSFRGRADYGYEGSDNTALHGIFLFNYRFRQWGSAFVGYRYLDIDFDNGSSRRDQYGFDGDQQGPAIGLNFYF